MARRYEARTRRRDRHEKKIAIVTDQEKRKTTIEAARDSLLIYIQLCDHRYIISAVHRFLAAALRRVAQGKCKRLIITMPPQHGKSRLIAVEFATWLLGQNPHLNVVLASYSGDLAKERSGEARLRLASEVFQEFFDTRLRYRWQPRAGWMTSKGGSYRAVGVEGTLTGRPCDVLIIDDPHKDHAAANSPTQRESVWQWYLSTAFTRLSPDGIIIVIHTRWHVDDLAGRLTDPARRKEMADQGIEGSDFEVINLPAIAEEADVMGRTEGAALFPERYGERRLREIKATLTSFLWSALYMGQPVPHGGHYINGADFNVIERESAPDSLSWVRFWDLATDENAMNDETASLQVAIEKIDAKTSNVYVRDGLSGRWNWPKSRGMIKNTAEAERVLVGIEAVAGFKTAYQNAREVIAEDIVLAEVGVSKDKLTRALPWIALTEHRRVFLIRGDWVTKFIAQCEQFPLGANDDLVDAMSGGYALAEQNQREVWVA